jgi:hypothetical protein
MMSELSFGISQRYFLFGLGVILHINSGLSTKLQPKRRLYRKTKIGITIFRSKEINFTQHIVWNLSNYFRNQEPLR